MSASTAVSVSPFWRHIFDQNDTHPDAAYAQSGLGAFGATALLGAESIIQIRDERPGSIVPVGTAATICSTVSDTPHNISAPTYSIYRGASSSLDLGSLGWLSFSPAPGCTLQPYRDVGVMSRSSKFLFLFKLGAVAYVRPLKVAFPEDKLEPALLKVFPEATFVRGTYVDPEEGWTKRTLTVNTGIADFDERFNMEESFYELIEQEPDLIESLRHVGVVFE